jgi:hypothetical protein
MYVTLVKTHFLIMKLYSQDDMMFLPDGLQMLGCRMLQDDRQLTLVPYFSLCRQSLVAG